MTAPYVLGIDSALERTGVGIIERTPDGCRARTEVVATVLGGRTPAERCRRIVRVVAGVASRVSGRAELALIEAPALDADGGDAWSRAAVWYGIISVLDGRGIPVAEVAPTTLKKWATNSGKADKPAMVRAMHVMWPGVPCTSNNARHHECESLGLAHIAAQYLGWPVPVRRWQGDSLAVVKWPAGLRQGGP